MSNDYAPVPWDVFFDKTISGMPFGLIVGSDKRTVVCESPNSLDYPLSYKAFEANARRIIACVNACEGIPTEALECQSKQKISEAWIKQRDNLTAALDRLAFAAECRDNTMGDPRRLIEVKAELAAAAAEARAVVASYGGR